MTQKDIELKIVEQSKEIAKAVAQGKDIYITKSPSGVVVRKLTVQKV